MKSYTKKIVILLILGLIFPIILNKNLKISVEQPTFNNPKTSSVYNGGILIDVFLTTNTSYSGNWTWAVSQPWCYDDNGVYIIEDLIINASTSPTGSGIYIVDSDNEYFIIRNCTIFDAGSGLNDGGIRLEETNNGTLINNNCSNNAGNGIYLDTNCKNNTILGNTVNNNEFGIYLYLNSNNNTILGNTANYNTDGIYLEDVHSNTISGNTANNNDNIGIYSYYFDYNNITENTANNNGNSGIYLEDECNNNAISGNTVNDNSDTGIHLSGNCDYNIIAESIVNNNTNNGVYIYDDCDSNTISNNFINGSGSADYGISVHWYSDKNIFIDNTVLHNVDIGIELYDFCEDNKVSDNVVSYNGLNGIGIYDFSDYNTITDNLLYNNTIGLYIDNSDNNTIYENVFSKNGKHAFDDGIDNTWNSTFFGNYWDNHTGPDFSPVDGIVDNPYTHIGGSAGSIDYFPFAEDGPPVITIQSPKEGGRFGNTAPTFSIIASDVYIVSMWYTLDDGLNNYTFTGRDGTISQSAWNMMSDGTITIKFYALDIAGNTGTAQITVSKNVPEEFDPTVVIVIVSIVGVALFGVILVLVKKEKISLDKIKGLAIRKK